MRGGQVRLFRAGKLQESQSMLAHLLEHLLQNKSEIQRKKPALDGSKLVAVSTDVADVDALAHPLQGIDQRIAQLGLGLAGFSGIALLLTGIART